MTTPTTKTTTTYKVEQLTTTTMNFMGMTPFYNTETFSLYWTDVIGGQLFRMDTTTYKTYTAKILGETYLSFIIPVDGTTTQFIVGAGKRLLLITWDGVHTMAQIVQVLTELPLDGFRFNFATTDKVGRLFVGTMIWEETGTPFDTTKKLGSLYSFTMDEGLVELKTKVGMAGGMTFFDKTHTFYFVDTYDMLIKQYLYDTKTGTISSEKTLTDLTTFGTPKMTYPYGMTIDTEGFLYVAMFGSGKILKINTTTGKVMTDFTLPVPTVTSMTFGGKTLDTMFITTAGLDAGFQWLTTGTTEFTGTTGTTGFTGTTGTTGFTGTTGITGKTTGTTGYITGKTTGTTTMTGTTMEPTYMGNTYPAGYLFKLTGAGYGTTPTNFITTI
jgi:sugar lactone lactonase YvrE